MSAHLSDKTIQGCDQQHPLRGTFELLGRVIFWLAIHEEPPPIFGWNICKTFSISDNQRPVSVLAKLLFLPCCIESLGFRFAWDVV